MSQVFPHRVVVYINGVRVFPISVSVNAARNQFLSFSVDVPGIPEWALLQPRSHAAVFFVDPVSLTWRFMCEGELMATQRTKDQAGSRTRTLQFRGLHGVLDTANYMSSGAALAAPLETGLPAVANGHNLFPSCSQSQATAHLSATTLLSNVATDNLASEYFLKIVKYTMLQLPVEAYYYHARQLNQKSFALQDTQISKIVDAALFQQMAEVGINDTKLTMDTPVAQLLTYYERILYYQHTPVLAPPKYNLAKDYATIPELLHLPQIYTVVPPACNVIFQDQIVNLVESDNYATQPTRVVLQTRLGQTNQPSFHVANSPRRAFNIGAVTETYAGTPGTFATHGILSRDEFERGVIPRYLPYDVMRKVQPNNVQQNSNTNLEDYLSQVARQAYVEAVGEQQPATLACTFLPYLQPGAPALVEDYSGPFHAFVESVTHILPSSSPPQTVVNLTFAKPAYVRNSEGDKTPQPVWLNDYFRPAGFHTGVVDSAGAIPTWERLLGKSLYSADGEQLSALAPKKTIQKATKKTGLVTTTFSSKYDADEVVDRDVLAAYVLPIPHYNDSWQVIDAIEESVAEKLRKQADVPSAMYQYNYRPGVNLSSYLVFHKLRAKEDATIDNGLNDPPEYVFANPKEGRALFCSPMGLEYVCPTSGVLATFSLSPDIDSGAKALGVYNLVADATGKRIDSGKQEVMLAIANGLKRQITRS